MNVNMIYFVFHQEVEHLRQEMMELDQQLRSMNVSNTAQGNYFPPPRERRLA